MKNVGSDEECIEKRKKWWKEHPEFLKLHLEKTRTPEALKKKSQSLKKTLSTPEAHEVKIRAGKEGWTNPTRKYQGVVSKIELHLKDLIECLGFRHNRKLLLGIGIPDFVHETSKVIVELYGDSFHHNPADEVYGQVDWRHPLTKKTSVETWEYDKKRSDKFISLGYRMFVVWESDLKRKKEEVIQQLVEFMKSEEKYGETHFDAILLNDPTSSNPVDNMLSTETNPAGPNLFFVASSNLIP
jgi:G:T-mismatch repair DNA endonuclease (very short patch repair protein)